MANTRKSSKRRPADSVESVTPVAEVPKPVEAAPKPVAAATVHPLASSGQHASVLKLGASLSIREVSECATQIKGLLSVGPTDIDATLLETIDTAGIQLLLAAAAAAQRRGFKLKLLGAQGLRTGAARSLGLSEHLGELAEIVP
jgi:anti-anti-sigma regulatory factor